MVKFKVTFILFYVLLFFGCQSQDEYRWISSDKGMELSYRDNKIGTLLKTEETRVVTSVDKIETVDSSLFKITRTCTAKERIDSVCISIAFEVNSASNYAIIPAVNYNGNDWGRGNEPKGFQHEGQWWTVSYRATPVP
jgi:hypothetical protein